jgi:hypothetical protein
MSVEKQTRLHSKLEELRRERQQLRDELEDRMKRIEQIDDVIRKFLKLKVNTIAEEKAKRVRKKKRGHSRIQISLGSRCDSFLVGCFENRHQANSG